MPFSDLSITAWIFVTLVLGGGGAWMTGRAIALTWRPTYQLVLYGILLAAAIRFIGFALFEGTLLNLAGFLVDCVILVGIAILAYRFVRAGQMVAQYPWLYRRAGPLGWAEKA
ncbi:MAG: DUF6867 family protein [Pseudomonadota bacterium]